MSLRFRCITCLVCLFVLLSGCTASALPASATVMASPTAIAAAAATATASPTAAMPTNPSEPAATPSPIPTIEPTLVPTPTTETVDISATVWISDPVVPVLMYHRFLPLNATNESATKMSLVTFRNELQLLDDAGFTLVPLADWLKGDLRVPAGRRPLILTIDDLFFADQIFLEKDGTPSLRSGIGVLWNFAQEHPEFGFSASLFYSLGDKYYGNKQVGDWFNVTDGWQQDLARAIAWCIEHNAMPYNHFWTHPQLVLMEPRDINDQLKKNEQFLEKLLDMIGKKDLAAKPDNLIALTYSVWPDSRGSRKAIMTYQSIHDKPVLGVLESDPHLRERYLMKAPYTTEFDPYHIPRMSGRMEVIQGLVQDKEHFQAADQCLFRVTPQEAKDSQALTKQIAAAAANGRCPAGVYALQGQLFRADKNGAELLALPPHQPK